MSQTPYTPTSPSRSTSRDAPPPIDSVPSSPRRRRKTTVYSDRFIPTRQGVDLQQAFSMSSVDPLPHSSNTENELDSLREETANRTFNEVLRTELFGTAAGTGVVATAASGSGSGGSSFPSTPPRNSTSSLESKVFSYHSPSKPRPSSTDMANDLYSTSPVRSQTQKLLLSPQRRHRTIAKVPYRVLDAPDLADDFYLNLVDWGPQDVLAVGLGSAVYLWDGASGGVSRLCELPQDDSITSLAWIGAGTHLAVGTHSGMVEIWDAIACKCTRRMTGHSSRASSLAWNQHILTSGSRDRSILHRDVREPAHFAKRLEAHKQEVCGLRWNVEENKLASGGNDNKLYVWDGMSDTPLHRYTEHVAAVKAIAWSPHQRGVLASGGGTADRHIKVWNTLTGTKLHDVDVGSQVCNLAWSRNSNELVSTHGYSRNQIVVWNYPSMQQIASLTGHSYRVLYLAMSPDGQTIVTGAGDETLRFWNVFEKSKSDGGAPSVLLDAFMQLR
ncbi:unnamed protein product [Kuraishia capsulata CBS 1993]|uniref:CDC20/Fizzy WD40 domain-containing protein n=1 Tax=Kuraishia capsulata CBS 1993 TaxID=1382522 RepID=W6MU29_9ASCO|nr:uncharacterized protein KUCA_T00006023001 [Kuraishia capsulata CBS 1993]CDK30028.1 unnamed protein product [Kuraishia capsulata CBS 1993]